MSTRPPSSRRSALLRAIAGVLVAGLLLGLAACGFATTDDLGADDVTHEEALLKGTAYSTKAGPITHWFEYGPTDAYGTSTPVQPATIDDPMVGIPVEATITGLEPEATYHFRLCVRDDRGYGICANDRTFTTDATPPPPPPPPPTGCFATFAGPAPHTVAAATPVSVTIDCDPFPTPIWRICITATFEGNLLDPGETVLFGDAPTSGFGATNVRSAPVQSDVGCATDAPIVARYGGGKATFDVFTLGSGSFDVKSVQVRAIAPPA